MWFKTNEGECKGVIILYHGLNNRPELMHPIAQKLKESGYNILVPALSGHTQSYNDFKKITHTAWVNDVKQAYELATLEAKTQDCPLYYIGFSLGGLLGVLLKAESKLPKVEKMCLLAPALETTLFANLLKPFLYFKLDISIPSKAPGFYRAHKRLPIQAYRAFFDIKTKLHQIDVSQVNIPVKLYIDKKDELVSYKKLTSFVTQNNLDNWQVYQLDSKESKGIHHMIADPFYAGKNNWQNMIEGAIDLFKKEHLSS